MEAEQMALEAAKSWIDSRDTTPERIPDFPPVQALPQRT
jgi:hypothetical protein